MKKTAIMGSMAFATAAAMGTVAIAQDEGGTDVEVEETEPNGAIVTREDIVEEREVVDENGDPVLDENGQPVVETVTTGWVQTVETPSGNIHTITKEDGSRAIVTHERPEKGEKPAKVERVAKAERPDKPEKPDRPEKPEKPAKPEKPGRPN